jgi:mannose-6-phosphate isomerase
MRPIRLAANQVPRFYRGGAAIAELRGTSAAGEFVPEDWVGSTTATYGSDAQGLTVLDDGRTLRAAVEADPEAFLGRRHVDAYGADPALLVKLLDAGERLPVHCHPGRGFAGRHLGCRHGKTEAWVVVSTQGGGSGGLKSEAGTEVAGGHLEPSGSPPVDQGSGGLKSEAGTQAEGGHAGPSGSPPVDQGPRVHLGFRDDADPEWLAGVVAGQRAGPLLASLNALPVAAGDTVLVPAGVPHAIGEGVLLVELQEPTDLSVLLEWDGFAIDGRRDGHLGLGFDLALRCVDRSGRGAAELARLRAGRGQVRPGVERLFPEEADPFFRAERLRPAAGEPATLDAGFSILVVTYGSGRVETEAGALDLDRGDTVLLPFAAGRGEVGGELEAIRCLPPAPEVSPWTAANGAPAANHPARPGEPERREAR